MLYTSHMPRKVVSFIPNYHRFENKCRKYSGVTIGPADPALQGAQKFHLSDGRRKQKFIGGI